MLDVAKALLEALTVLLYFLAAREFQRHRICWQWWLFMTYLPLRGIQVWIESATMMERPWPIWAGVLMFVLMGLVTLEIFRQVTLWLPPQETRALLAWIGGLVMLGCASLLGFHIETGNVTRPIYHEIRSLVHRGLALVSWGTFVWFWIAPHPAVDRQMRAHLCLWAAYLTNKVWPSLTTPTDEAEAIGLRLIWLTVNCLLLIGWMKVAAMRPADCEDSSRAPSSCSAVPGSQR